MATAMHSKHRTRIAVVGIVVAILACAFYVRQKARPQERSITGVITRLDAGQRRAELVFTHPRTGEQYPIEGEVAADCAISINGQPARLEDLNVGEEATVRGLVYRFPAFRVVATEVTVVRHVTAGSASDTQTAATIRPPG
jgi:hypothetical protein